MPGGPGAQNGKGGPKWPELCIKTVIALCAGISQNHNPRLLTLPFRTGRFELALEVQRWTAARSEYLPGGPKIIVTPLLSTGRRLHLLLSAGACSKTDFYLQLSIDICWRRRHLAANPPTAVAAVLLQTPALSSKPADRRCCCRSVGQTGGQTDGRRTVT